MEAVAPLEQRELFAGLVGDEALEAVPVEVGEAKLRAGVGTLLPDDQACPFRPRGEINAAGQLRDPGAAARVAFPVDGALPRPLGSATAACPTRSSTG